MKRLLSGNEALALGAYHAGVKVAAAYPGTPSSEILETLATFKDIHAEWSTNEKVALEVALGASYAGVRAMASMKQVGLNVASDPFMAAATTGVRGGLVIVSADDPGIHSSQNEQDNRHYARMAKVPMLEPADSQEAYDFIALAFDISEEFDTPVLVRTTTRISHSKSVVEVKRTGKGPAPAAFKHDVRKFVMLPAHARLRRPLIEQRLSKLQSFAETFPCNFVFRGSSHLGVISSGVAYQYAREVFPDASFLKLGMTYPLPERLIREFAASVERLIVIEELDPFLEENILAMGIKVQGKEFVPRFGELSPEAVERAARQAGWLEPATEVKKIEPPAGLPPRPPVLCPGCPHTGVFFVLNTIGQRSKLLDEQGKSEKEGSLIITGDIGCYTLATYPPLQAMDTTACMGAGIGQALGMEKAGVTAPVVAVIGDSTFLHSGITGVVNAIYNQSRATIIILDNGTTAMTGHQDHPGTGISAQGEKTTAVDLEQLVRGVGVQDVKVVSAFDIKALRAAIREAIDSPRLSVVIVRGGCSVRLKTRSGQRAIDREKCDDCGVCLRLGCPAIQKFNDELYIDATLCAGNACTICEQLCPRRAIAPTGPPRKETA